VRARWALSAAALVALLACATPPRPASHPPPLSLSPTAGEAEEGEKDVAGVVHVVRRGQTLYRIARTYGVDPNYLMETNGITDPRTLSVGQELFVPGATKVLEVEEAPGALPRKSPGDPPPPPPPPPRPARAAGEPEGDEALSPPEPRPILAWPLKGVLYGRFGIRAGVRHDGIDIAAPEGSPISAAADGTVLFVGEQSGYGNVVILRHDNGLVTVYAHASVVLVKEGAHVSRGQPVARVGQTGRTTGPHLHFEVREGVKPKNPLLYLP